jgi:predicted Zn-dependent protease
MWSQLNQAIAAFNIPADWIGIRVVKEISNSRSVRDGLPQANGKTSTLGAMVEVLVNGCIGYAATNSLDLRSLQAASEKAYKQALAASEWWIYPFKASERPKVVGEYVSPYLESLDTLSPGEINHILVRICQTLKVSEKIVQTRASAITSEMETWRNSPRWLISSTTQ